MKIIVSKIRSEEVILLLKYDFVCLPYPTAMLNSDCLIPSVWMCLGIETSTCSTSAPLNAVSAILLLRIHAPDYSPMPKGLPASPASHFHFLLLLL